MKRKTNTKILSSSIFEQINYYSYYFTELTFSVILILRALQFLLT